MSHVDPAIPSQDLPPWVVVDPPRDAHRAALRALLHTPTGAHLVQLWFSRDSWYAVDGWYEWHVIGVNGWRWKAAEGEDPPHLFAQAEDAIHQMLKMTNDAQLGG